MAFSIRVSGLDAHGVELISPARPEFDDIARPLLGERIADVGLSLKPMLVIVSNENVQTVVSLALVWCVTHRSGRTTRFWSHARRRRALRSVEASGSRRRVALAPPIRARGYAGAIEAGNSASPLYDPAMLTA